MANDHNAGVTHTEGGRLASSPPDPGKGCQCPKCVPGGAAAAEKKTTKKK